MDFIEETRGEYKGFEYVVLFNALGHRCGYAGIPEGHELYKNKDSNILDTIECHGGITFSDFAEWLGPKKWWIGFDYTHFGDALDIESIKKYFGEEAIKEAIGSNRVYIIYPEEHIWVLDECIEECKHIIDQICEV